MNLRKLDILKDIRKDISEENRLDVYTAIFETDPIDLTSPVLQDLREKVTILVSVIERYNNRKAFIEGVQLDYEMTHDKQRISLTHS